MSKGGGSAPAAPNPNQTAATQSKYNQQTALYQSQLNNVNQNTPYGNQTFTMTPYQPSASDAAAYGKAQNDYKTGGIWTDTAGGTSNRAPTQADFQSGSGAPTWTSNIQLSPAEQKLLDNQQALQTQAQGVAGTVLGQAQSNMATPYSLSGVPQLASANDISNQQSTVYKDLMSRLQPQLDRDQAALDNKLANQGITQGSEAWNTAQTLQNQAKNDAYMQAQLQGVNAGQIYNNEALANNQQGVANYNQQYNAPLNEYNSLMSGVQVQNPTFAPPQNTQVAPTDYMGAVQNAYQAALNSYNAKNSSSNGLMGSLFGLGGSFLGGPLGGMAGSALGNAFGGGNGGLSGMSSTLAGGAGSGITWNPLGGF